MAASTLDLELTVLSCRDLKAFNFFQKLSLYAAVSIFSDPANSNGRHTSCQPQRQKTLVDRVGDRNPDWNHTMSFNLEPFKSSPADEKLSEDVFVRFEVRCEGTVFGNRTVGETRVPLRDLVEEFHGARRFLSYQVKTGDGRANGVLNFSYKVNGKSSTETSATDNQKFRTVEPTPRVHELRFSSPEVIQTKPKDISYPRIDIADTQPVSLLPLMLSQQTAPYDNVFYAQSNRQDIYSYEMYPPAPVPENVPRQYPSKMEVTGYGYSLWGHNQFRV
ncbi:uncharacterized protein LOC116199217 [Punica granatum]|uniref:C2 domain-containing protein n=2 Tax=Punica granatum TaxID=22663 RepID=A0A218XXD5_PUNGR|nr:uncharacterized protein LOC116199217 [Punica granatum]OWM89825.1 hypothetical protein CDL15_Pgr024574 [Punica granatum]PKI71572.1 hypothetical protein CRG98_008089 [Punica granatum]